MYYIYIYIYNIYIYIYIYREREREREGERERVTELQPLLAKKGTFLKKRAPKISPPPTQSLF